MKTKLLYSMLILFQCLSAHAQSTTRDSSFGENGRAICTFGTTDDVLSNIALLPNGKIVACGKHYLVPDNNPNDVALCRFNANGTLDQTFGTAGRVTLPGGSYTEIVTTDLKILDSGKILVLGYTVTYQDPNVLNKTVLFRFNANGSLDTTFGTNGFRDVSPVSGNNLGNVMLIQPNGKIIIGGNAQGTTYDSAVFRLNANGSKDIAFGNNGLTVLNFGASSANGIVSYDEIIDLKFQADGKIVAGGYTMKETRHSTDSKFSLLRLKANGNIDTSFGGNGGVTTNFGNFEDRLANIQILPNQKIIAVGTSNVDDNILRDIAIARYKTDGTLDTNYGQGGKVLFTNNSPNPRYEAHTSLLNSDNSLVVGGIGNPADDYTQFGAMFKFLPNGTPDTTFGNQGVYLEETNLYPADILLQPNGKLLLAGTLRADETNFKQAFAVYRYGNSGKPRRSENILNFRVFPNPFSEVVNIDFDGAKRDAAKITLADQNGNAVMTWDAIEVEKGKNALSLQVPESLRKGIYFLNIAGTETEIVYKLVK